MNYRFYASGTCYYKGTVEAESKEEALKMIGDRDYDEIDITDDTPDLSNVYLCDIEEEKEIY